MKEFSTEELASFNGTNGQPVYIAVRGQVFDVTSGSTFYGPGGPYEVFAGKECARALAIMKIAQEECNDDLSDCTEKQLTTLQDWVKKFTAKYPIVGKVAGSPASEASSTATSPVKQSGSAGKCPVMPQWKSPSVVDGMLAAAAVALIAYAAYKAISTS